MNGIIVIDKQEGWTSHDVVAKLRGILREKRIGHGGTLDPMATGVLPAFVGRATRAVEFCESFDKEYVAGLRLGLTTDTQDTTGTVLSTSMVSVTRRDVEDVLRRFTGEQEQVPPMYSAVKIGGKKLYELARRGQEVPREPRRIIIGELELLEMTESDVIFRAVCSKGTYIRTLCHDIGSVLGCGGTMSSLQRTRVGPFQLSHAVTLEQIERVAGTGDLADIIRDTDTLFGGSPAMRLDARQKAKCLNGAPFPVLEPDGLYRVYDDSAVFLMLGEAHDGVMRTVKSFFDV